MTSGPSSGGKKPSAVLIALRALSILAASCWIYGPSLRGDWIMDDFFYVAQNPMLRDVDGIWRAWFQPLGFIEYYPLEESVRWLQWQLWQDATLGYHLTNLFLHIAGAFLVWRLLEKFGLRWAWLGGLIFAIHPANVESVAWISELKNTLALPPFLLAMCFYLDYENTGRRKFYAWSLLLFLAAMLCKVSMASFPFVILLYAWWKRGRVGWRDLGRAAPFACISLLLGLLTIACGIRYDHTHVTASAPIPVGGLLSHLALAGTTASFYLVKSILPIDPMFIYPQWNVNPPSLLQFLPWLLFPLFVGWLWARRDTWGRHALLGLGFFAILLLPFVGFQDASWMRFTWAMDHFLYFPLIGIIGLAVAGWENGQRRLSLPARRVAIVLLVTVLALLVWESHDYSRVFRGSESVWADTIRKNPSAWIAYNNLGETVARRGQITAAMRDYEQALAVDPLLSGPHINLGNAWQKLGRYPEAVAEYREALLLQSDAPEADNNWGNALNALGHPAEAVEKYQAALRLDPEYVDARTNLGATLISLGHRSDGMDQYRAALRLDPQDAQAHEDLGIALGESGQYPEAVQELKEAARLEPGSAEVYNNLGVALYKNGEMAEAMQAYQQARAIQAAAGDASTPRAGP
jgi:tetratricopeptide (TPR) repeat protein